MRTNDKFKVNDIFFFRFTSTGWVIGKVTLIDSAASLIHFDTLKCSDTFSNILTVFDIDSEMYNDSRLMHDMSDSSVLAMIL